MADATVFRQAPSRRQAFSLVEIIVTVGLLGFIVLGLTAMFVQTQRTFHAGITQTDVLESGRATMDLLTRELEGITPSRLANATNFYTRYETYSTNSLTGADQPRTNVLSCIFAVVEKNRQWTGIGYAVAFPGDAISDHPVGTLYRFQYPPGDAGTNHPGNISTIFYTNAVRAVNNGIISTRFNRVADGVVHLRVLAYDNKGILLSPTNAASNMLVNNQTVPIRFANDFPSIPVPDPGMIEYTGTNNAVPAYLDLELAVLEPKTLERYRAIPVGAARLNFLQRQAGGIHVFRRRIAVHNVDPEAYR